MISEANGWLNLSGAWINADLKILPGISSIMPGEAGNAVLILANGGTVNLPINVQQAVEKINTTIRQWKPMPPPTVQYTPPQRNGAQYSDDAHFRKHEMANAKADAEFERYQAELAQRKAQAVPTNGAIDPNNDPISPDQRRMVMSELERERMRAEQELLIEQRNASMPNARNTQGA